MNANPHYAQAIKTHDLACNYTLLVTIDVS
jgi:hypothetical protein